MTNYFLMSLAVADLLVCMIVMPFGAIVFFKGQFIQFFTNVSCICNLLKYNISLSKPTFSTDVMFEKSKPNFHMFGNVALICDFCYLP